LHLLFLFARFSLLQMLSLFLYINQQTSFEPCPGMYRWPSWPLCEQRLSIYIQWYRHLLYALCYSCSRMLSLSFGSILSVVVWISTSKTLNSQCGDGVEAWYLSFFV
jgi:hypothetical protein